MLFRWVAIPCLLAIVFFLAGCAVGDKRHKIIVSVPDQELLLLRDEIPIAIYPVSTSKFGLSDQPNSNGTPLGEFRIHTKIGDGLPLGAVLKSRRPTGEIIPVNAPGRDPIVTRILWLEGREAKNRNASSRFIYIHGTPEERTIGQPASYGCIRMRSQDVAALYGIVGTGARVRITTDHLPPRPQPTTPTPIHAEIPTPAPINSTP